MIVTMHMQVVGLCRLRVSDGLGGSVCSTPTDPAEISISESTTFDRDGDGNDDSVEIEYQVLSQAFYERVDVYRIN